MDHPAGPGANTTERIVGLQCSPWDSGGLPLAAGNTAAMAATHHWTRGTGAKVNPGPECSRAVESTKNARSLARFPFLSLRPCQDQPYREPGQIEAPTWPAPPREFARPRLPLRRRGTPRQIPEQEPGANRGTCLGITFHVDPPKTAQPRRCRLLSRHANGRASSVLHTSPTARSPSDCFTKSHHQAGPAQS